MTITTLASAVKPVPCVVTCQCGCRFSFEKSDAKFNDPQFDTPYWSVPCPECERTQTVAASLVNWDPFHG